MFGVSAAQKAGAATGTEEVNCCGGGAACGHVYCPALASSADGCMAVWDITGMGMSIENDCGAATVDTGMIDPGFAVDPGFGIGPVIDPVFGVDTSAGVAEGGTCAVGFCEDSANCPQCSAGLDCAAPVGQMCAGTCFGTCQSGHRRAQMAGAATGTEEVNCCGGGAACGHVYCPALASSADGCMAVWDITGMGMTEADCGAATVDTGMIDPGFGVDPLIAVDPAFGVDTSAGATEGGRCAVDFCEDASNCPRCAAGLECQAPEGQFCAGTCFGTCGAAAAPNAPPEGCLEFFDGCNTCHRAKATDPLMCTMMMCGPWADPSECRLYAQGFGPEDGHRRAQLGGGGMAGGGDDPHNCCGGGAACGHIYCPGLATSADGCMPVWSAPQGADLTKVCEPSIAVDPGFAVDPLPPVVIGVADNSIGAPNGCMNWNDGCNTCSRFTLTDSFSCTEMACFWQGTPSCLDEAVAVEGERCATSSWCESDDCPQCASGLTCQSSSQICAGTCYGTCSGGH